MCEKFVVMTGLNHRTETLYSSLYKQYTFYKLCGYIQDKCHKNTVLNPQDSHNLNNNKIKGWERASLFHVGICIYEMHKSSITYLSSVTQNPLS